MTKTILVVEDNPISCKLIREALADLPCDVHAVGCGADALAFIANEQPVLVLADLGLPDMHGFELLARIREHPHGERIPVLACSAAWSGLDDARARGGGFDDVIVKPIDTTTLRQVVRGYLPAKPREDARFGAGKRALAVDDDPVQLKLLAYRLEELGFDTVLARDGLEALERARTTSPACIVSDVMMPRVDGFELARAIRADPALAQTVVVLATNTYVEANDRELARRFGADELVVRSPELTEVLDAVRIQLEGQRPPAVHSVEAADGDLDLDLDRMRRIIRQLERQIGINARQAQRNAALATELAIVNGVSAALVHGHDLDQALRSVLAASMDAGALSIGALYLAAPGEAPRVLVLGGDGAGALADCFTLPSVQGAIRSRRTFVPTGAELGLKANGGTSFLIIPIVYGETSLGALLLGLRDSRPDDLELARFGETVANQLALAYMMAQSFAARARSEADAQTQAQLLKSIFDTVGDGIVTASAHSGFMHWNAAATSILRLGLSNLPPDRWSEHFGLCLPDGTSAPPEGLPLVRAMQGEHVEGLELVARPMAGGDDVWLSVNARPLAGDGPNRGGAVAVFRDVTEQKKAQAHLMVSDRMASIGMLAAGVAHEINNPLAALITNLEFLDEDLRAHVAELGEPTSRVADMLDTVQMAREASDRVRQIVKDLKIFSRAEEDRRTAVDVERVLDSSLRMAWNEVRHRARIVKHFGRVPHVQANEARLGQVFLNLIVNAAQAIPEGRATAHEIAVTTLKREDGWVVTRIRDTGPGIPPDVLSKLFTPFFTTKPAGQGTGLGLVICQRIVHSLGGTINVESKLGNGTTFSIALPSCEDTVEDTPPRRSVRPATRRGNVFVIDDDVAVSNSIRRAIASDHDVTTYTDATKALADLASGAVPDLILCDLMMPLMSGAEFFQRLETVRPETADRVVFLTGGVFTPAAREFLDRVPNPRIEKPFELANIRSLIHDRVR